MEQITVSRDPFDTAAKDGRAELPGLSAHAGQQGRARYAAGKSRMIVGAGDQRRPAFAGVHDGHGQAETGQINGGRQPRRASANDDAVALFVRARHDRSSDAPVRRARSRRKRRLAGRGLGWR
jgi:hypothetical protein